MLSSSYDAAVERAITSANEAWIARPPARMTPRFPTVTSKGLRGANWRLALADIYPALRREGLALEEQSSDVYEFGVASGGSLELLRSIFGRARLIGFDTFTGLPDYPNEEQVKLWTPGRFSPMGVRRNTSTAHEGAAAVRRWLNGRLGRGRVGELEFVVGHYDETLSLSGRAPGSTMSVAEALVRRLRLKPAAYVDIGKLTPFDRPRTRCLRLGQCCPRGVHVLMSRNTSRPGFDLPPEQTATFTARR